MSYLSSKSAVLLTFNSRCLEEESKKTKDDSVTETMPATKAFLWSVIECAELLCNVTIKSKLIKERPERSVSHGAFTSDSVQPTGIIHKLQLKVGF